MESPTIQPLSDFELKKRLYFSRFALSFRKDLKLHQEYGVLSKKEGWRNVSEHCLLEAVMVDVLAEQLGLSKEERENLVTGALLHDFYKREQMRIIKEGGGSTESLEKSEEESNRILQEKNYPEGVFMVAGSASDVKRMALLYSEVALIEKIIFYVDSITMNNQISSVAERIQKQKANERYKRIDEEAKEYLGGKTQLEAMEEISIKIQKELAERLGIEDPETLPKWIEREIKKRIEDTN